MPYSPYLIKIMFEAHLPGPAPYKTILETVVVQIILLQPKLLDPGAIADMDSYQVRLRLRPNSQPGPGGLLHICDQQLRRFAHLRGCPGVNHDRGGWLPIAHYLKRRSSP